MTTPAAAKIKIQTFLAPRGFDWVPFFGVGTFYVSALFLGPITTPGSPSAATLNAWFPGGTDGFAWLVTLIIWPVIAIHVGEAWWFDRTRCRAHSVQRGSLTWLLWMGAVFMEGISAFLRFDGLVKEEEEKKQKRG